MKLAMQDFSEKKVETKKEQLQNDLKLIEMENNNLKKEKEDLEQKIKDLLEENEKRKILNVNYKGKIELIKSHIEKIERERDLFREFLRKIEKEKDDLKRDMQMKDKSLVEVTTKFAEVMEYIKEKEKKKKGLFGWLFK